MAQEKQFFTDRLLCVYIQCDWLFRFIAQGLDVRLAREWFLRPLSRCVDVFTPVG